MKKQNETKNKGIDNISRNAYYVNFIKRGGKRHEFRKRGLAGVERCI
jgi:hypothetical protein